MINLQNVTKRYPNGHQALSDVNLHIDRGEMAFLIGHSGAGKSSLLKLIALLDRPNEGQITVDDVNLNKLPRRRIPKFRQELGIILQAPMLLNELTVFDNVALPLQIASLKYHEIRKRVHTALDRVNLLQKTKLTPPELSAGEQQRLNIARAIVKQPKLLLADEPTGNLDPALSTEIIQLFKELNALGISVLFATHDLTLIAGLKHRIITLKDGAIL